MDSRSKIAAKVTWRLLLAFVVAFFMPLIMTAYLQPWSIALSGLICIVGVYWYLKIRIQPTLNRLLKVAQRITVSRGRKAGTAHHDELTNLVHTFDNFCDELESAYLEKAESKVGEETTHDTPVVVSDPTDTVMIHAVEDHAVFKAKLSTGASVVGQGMILPSRVDEENLLNSQLTGRQAEEMFETSITSVKKQLKQLNDVPELSANDRGILEFQSLLLEDESLHQGIETCLADGLTLPESLNTTFAVIRSKLEMSKNAYVAARSADCDDLRQRLLSTTSQLANPGVEDCYTGLKGKIALCQQIYPSEVIMLHKAGVKGIVSVKGTASSHAEILMQSFNVPSLANIEGLSINVLKGRRIMLDVEKKNLIVDPTDAEVKGTHKGMTEITHAIESDPITLKSGEPILVQATINNVALEIDKAVAYGADGVGLFRSEMSYIGRPDMPEEEELYEEYARLTKAFEGKPVCMRMLDLGSDKVSLFQTKDEEENPCMGNRSMRLLLKRPGVFRTQLRAMLRAAREGTTILFPMISGWHELDRIQTAVERMSEELVRDGGEIRATVRYGLMVEVPSIVERFEDYVNGFDLFNIGTNDLTQYALAADRNNENVAEYFKTFHPSILSMIAKVCRLSAKHDKKACICGEMASQLPLIPLLVGLGANCFSIPYHGVPKTKSFIANLDMDACRALAQETLECRSTDDVEDVLADFNDQFRSLLA